MAGKGKSIDISVPMVQAAARGLTAVTSSDTAWMGPGKTLQAIVPQAYGRQFDYQAGANLSISPRASEQVSFPELRGLAECYYIVRNAIETRKDQMAKMKGSFKPVDDKKAPDARCDELNEFFKSPDKVNSFSTWVRMLMEDLLVIDAPTVVVQKAQGGGVYCFEAIDGATIKVLIDQYGRMPVAPEAAFQQNLHGVPAVNYTSDQLIYRPRNKRTHKTYGYSPVEQLVMIVNIGLRRTVSQLQFYTEGNIPEALIGTPSTWNPDQIAAYQQYWDGLFEGNTASRRHAKFVPGGMDVHETKSATLTDAFDEWLARVVQYCFSLPATPYLKQVNKGETTNMKEQAEEEGLTPILDYFAEFFDALKDKFWGYTDIEWRWDDEKSIDPLVQAQIDQIYLLTDVMEKNEIRARLGLEARDYEKEAAVKLKAAQDALPPAGQQTITPGQPGAKNETDMIDVTPKDGEQATKGLKAAGKKPKYAKLSTTNVARAKILAGGITKVFAKQKPKIIKQVVEHYGKASADKSFTVRTTRLAKAESTADQIAADVEINFDAIVTVSAVQLKKAAREGADNAVDFLDGRGETVDAAEIAVGIGDHNAAELVTGIDETTRGMIAKDIDDAFKEGLTTDELADRLADNYAFSDARAETISRTEIAMADQQASMQAYRDSGVVPKKKWSLAEEPCPICEDNANDGTIDIDDTFSSGDDAAPAHPNCECVVLPVIEDEATNTEQEE